MSLFKKPWGREDISWAWKACRRKVRIAGKLTHRPSRCKRTTKDEMIERRKIVHRFDHLKQGRPRQVKYLGRDHWVDPAWEDAWLAWCSGRQKQKRLKKKNDERTMFENQRKRSHFASHGQKLRKIPKIFKFGEFWVKWYLRSRSVTRHISNIAQCLKITEKVSFYNSERSELRLL